MSTRRLIPNAVLQRQIEASDPAVSAWVSANAGSGKTHVLAQRVIRLLLEGAKPERILCITFTKAAAANMAKRVFDTLAQWTAYDDDALDRAVAATSGITPDPQLRARARQLFALALETPGGLKVQTIHAFCTRLLHQFPFEANVAARFEVLDAVSEARLLNEVSVGVLLDASARPGDTLGSALATAISLASDMAFKSASARPFASATCCAAGWCAESIDQRSQVLRRARSRSTTRQAGVETAKGRSCRPRAGPRWRGAMRASGDQDQGMPAGGAAATGENAPTSIAVCSSSAPASCAEPRHQGDQVP